MISLHFDKGPWRLAGESLYDAAQRFASYHVGEKYEECRGVIHVDPEPTTKLGHYFLGYCDGFDTGYYEATVKVPRLIRWVLRLWPFWPYRYGYDPTKDQGRAIASNIVTAMNTDIGVVPPETTAGEVLARSGAVGVTCGRGELPLHSTADPEFHKEKP